MMLSQPMAVPPIFFECFNPQSWLLWIVGGFVSSLQSYTPMFLTGPIAYFVPNWHNGLPRGYFGHFKYNMTKSKLFIFPFPKSACLPFSFASWNGSTKLLLSKPTIFLTSYSHGSGLHTCHLLLDLVQWHPYYSLSLVLHNINQSLKVIL